MRVREARPRPGPLRRADEEALGRRVVVARLAWAVCAASISSQAAIAAGGPSSLSGKPRPETGVVLLEPVTQSRKTVAAELLVASSQPAEGIAAIVVFESEFALAKGNYYDIEARNRDGDASFIHVAAMPPGSTLETLPASFFTDTALGATGRFSSYSAPQIASVSSGVKMSSAPQKLPCSATRFVDVSFSALTQAGFEVPRKGTIAAIQPLGSSDVLLLVSSVGAARWRKGGSDDIKLASESFRVTAARRTPLRPTFDNDYRYSGRSLKGFSEDQSEIEAALARDLATQSGGLTGKFGAAAAATAGGAGGGGVAGYSPNF